MLDIYLIHGISKSIDPRYYDGFVEGIRKYLPIDFDVHWRPIDYSSILAKKEEAIFSWMDDLPYKSMRRFACDFICDALAYGYPHRNPSEGDFIYDLHQMIGEKIGGGRMPAKKVIIGHSLGSIVGYGLTWEFKTDCLITMGSPFCYFSVRYKNFGEMNKDLPQMHNFWRGRDPVSTIISRNPNFSSVQDYEVKSFNPLYQLPFRSHSIYWSSEYVQKEIARILKSL